MLAPSLTPHLPCLTVLPHGRAVRLVQLRLLYDHATVEPRLLTPRADQGFDAPHFKSTLFGPTCDGIDQVAKGAMMPELMPGDWLRFDRMGAYTRCAGSAFNGFSNAALPTFYIFCRDECR